MAIARLLDHSCQPQPRRNHHGQSHPRNHFASFHPYFIGLNMHQIQVPLLDDPLMHSLTMRSCSITPIGDRSLIQTQGMHYCLDWTPIGQEGHDDHNQFLWFAQPFKHRCPTATERCFADGTAIALPFAIMDTNIALSSLASCRTRLIRAKCFRRVHWLWCTLLHKYILPRTVSSCNPSSLHRIMGSYRRLVCCISSVFQVLFPCG